MRSARLRLPSNINLLVKRATFRLLYFASGTSGRRTTLLRLGTICLLLKELACNSSAGGAGGRSPLAGVWGKQARGACIPHSLLPPLLARRRQNKRPEQLQ